MTGSGHPSASGTWPSLTFSTFITGRPASKPGDLRAVQLQEVQADEFRDLPHLVRVLVDEDSDDRGPQRQAVDDRLRLLGRDAALRRAEMKADQVGAGFDCRGGSGRVADAADLHLDHAVSSLMRSSGFSARISASPTRIALAPAS